MYQLREVFTRRFNITSALQGYRFLYLILCLPLSLLSLPFSLSLSISLFVYRSLYL